MCIPRQRLIKKTQGGVVCLSCCAFFRRSVTLKMLYTCVQNQNCVVHHNLRMLCRSCRYQKCLDSNLQPKLVQKPRSKTLLGKRNKKEKSTCPEEVKISPIKDEILYPEINTPQSCPKKKEVIHVIPHKAMTLLYQKMTIC
uniref:Nuclear receptor domain-containing protein n=1 Tax=Rhabditophanes sp. KR3021 TaxID=114890 RepID=A0AC35TN20_9BILA